MIEVYVKRAPALRKAACDVTEVREAAAAGASSRPPQWSGPLKRVSSASLPQSHSLSLAPSGSALICHTWHPLKK